MKNKIIQILALWFLAEAIIWIFFHQVITYSNIIIAIPYFLILSIIGLVIFKDIFTVIVRETRESRYFMIIISLLLHGLTYWVCTRYLGEPTELIKHNTSSFILVNNYFLWAKPMDILLQQIMIMVLVLKLQQNKINLRSITAIIVVIFGATHIYSVQHMELLPAIFLTVFAIILSIIFPYLILRVKNGYLYNLMIHMAFVDIAALLFWSVF